ncbi:hypothetical protein J7E81_22170 [Bacillus sp. ISL-18]|uniref:hypothetical protein n=1 Tax=Bacillus sp. ISL-18 TaxID=2819118 RepID=UPI001BE6A7DC|nr:hypothetical protein [Bacillus sp. ISL-18]MBT2657913.1 hypothetical protein [Bacillus sp. ISL-18]
MKMVHFLIWVLLIIATVLGVNGQSLAYFMDELFKTNRALNYLTVLTIISVLIYIVIPLFAYLKIRVKKFALIYIFGFGIIGFCISGWSVFVCAMWWG